MQAEIWKPVVGCENAYEVSSLGRIRSLYREVKTIRYNREYKVIIAEQLLTLCDKKSPPNFVVHLRYPNKTVYVHAIVARAFYGERPNGYEIRHLNCNNYDNRVENIAYGSRRENSLDVWRNNRFRKLTKDDVICMRKAFSEGRKSKEISKIYGVSVSTVNRIKRGVTFSWLNE